MRGVRIGAKLKARAIGYQWGGPVHRRQAVQLRLALSAAVLCAVLAAATFSGAHRGGSPGITMAREPEPILVRLVSTITRLYVEKVVATP